MYNIFKPDINGEKIGIPALLTCIYLLCMPLSVVPLPGGISLLKVISIVIGPLLIAALFFEKNEIKLNIVHLFIALYMIYSIASLFLLRDENSWENLRGILQTGLILMLISTRIYNRREKNMIFYSWILIGLITVIAMMTGSVELGDSERMTMNIGGGNEDPNQLCGYFFLPILVCLDKVIEKKKFRMIYILLIFLMIYVAFTTGSRGGLLAIFATVLANILLAIRGITNKIKVMATLAVVLTLFFTVFYPMLPEMVRDRMTIESVQEDKGSGRFDLWVATYNSFTSEPSSMVFGYGIGSTTYFLTSAGFQNTVAHNHWLQLLCDQGIVGFLLFFMIILTGCLRNYKYNKIITISLLGMVVLSMSLTLYAFYKPFWNILMMAAMNFEGEL